MIHRTLVNWSSRNATKGWYLQHNGKIPLQPPWTPFNSFIFLLCAQPLQHFSFWLCFFFFSVLSSLLIARCQNPQKITKPNNHHKRNKALSKVNVLYLLECQVCFCSTSVNFSRFDGTPFGMNKCWMTWFLLQCIVYVIYIHGMQWKGNA